MAPRWRLFGLLRRKNGSVKPADVLRDDALPGETSNLLATAALPPHPDASPALTMAAMLDRMPSTLPVCAFGRLYSLEMYLIEQGNPVEEIQKLHDIMKMDRVVLEIGCGRGEIAWEIASKNPDMGVLATDKYDWTIPLKECSHYQKIGQAWKDRLLEAQVKPLDNLVILRSEDDVMDYLPDRSIDSVLLVNPEPNVGRAFIKWMSRPYILKKIKPGPRRMVIKPFSREMGVMACGGYEFEHGEDWSRGLGFLMDGPLMFKKSDPVQWSVNLSAASPYSRNSTQTGVYIFGNPEKPEIMGQFVGAIQGIGEACTALGMPIVSGNVSLYNETDGQPILPTPTIGAVGLIGAPEDLIAGTAQEGDFALLLGETQGHLGQSALLAEAFGRELGDAPAVDLEAERKAGEILRENGAMIHAATDLSDGGLALAAFEMAEAAGLGVALEAGEIDQLFGEDQARYLIACGFDQAEGLMIAAGQAGLPIAQVGRFGGEDVQFGSSCAPLAELSTLFRSAFADQIA